MTEKNSPSRPWTSSENVALAARAAALLPRQCALYTMDDSSSLPRETAESLYASLCFSLRRYLVEKQLFPLSLAHSDWEELYRQSLISLQEKTVTALALHRQLCGQLSPLSAESAPLNDTLQSIGQGFSKYDLRYFALDFPCSIDYQLLQSVPETVCGIDYIVLYLERLIREDRFLSRFDPAAALPVLRAAGPEYLQTPLNLCEPLLTQCVGIGLSGEAADGLFLSPARLTRLQKRLEPLDPARRTALLRQTAGALASNDPETADYLAKAMAKLEPRLSLALKSGHLSAVFLCRGTA